MKIPEGIRFADIQSAMNFERVASGGMAAGLLVLEGVKASGKTRLAKHLLSILGFSEMAIMPNEKTLERIFNVEKPQVAFFDEVNTAKPTRKNSVRVIHKPLESAAILAAIDGGVLVILAGFEVTLAADLETRAIRVRLGQNA